MVWIDQHPQLTNSLFITAQWVAGLLGSFVCPHTASTSRDLTTGGCQRRYISLNNTLIELGKNGIISFKRLARVPLECDHSLVFSLLQWYGLCFEVEGGLLFPNLLPIEPGISEKVKRDHIRDEEKPHIGRRWIASAPKHIFPSSFFSGLQVSLLQDKGKGRSTAWSHGIHLHKHEQAAMMRLDAREAYFDVVVWVIILNSSWMSSKKRSPPT